MPPRRALIVAGLAGACAPPRPRPAAPGLSAEAVAVAAEAWHTDLCLPVAALRPGPLAPLAPAWARALAFGFGLDAWMRADRPGVAEMLGALAGGPAVVSVRALSADLPPGAEEAVALRLPEGGSMAIIRFVAGQLAGPPAAAPAGGALLLLPSRLRYTLAFTCNTWVMRALAEGGLPVPVDGIRLRGEAMAALRAEARRQAG